MTTPAPGENRGHEQAPHFAQNRPMPNALPTFVQPCGQGVYAVDTGFVRPHFAAAYLMVHAGRAAIIDTGPAPGVPRILGALDALGVGLDAVDYVIPTHVHLDHAGGAGQLMQACTGATLLVHPRGQRHMVDPSALWAGATAVYGPEEMARDYGQVLPIAIERTQVTQDGQRLMLAGRELLFADTPGHARHHHCIWDAATRGWFTGDTFGLSYREFDTAAGPWMLPTSTPVQFEPDVLRASIQRLLDQDPQRIYPVSYTHLDVYKRQGWNGEVIEAGDRAAIESRLAAVAAQADQPEVHLRPNKLVIYKHVAMIMATAQRLGVTKIGIVGNEQFL